LYKKQKKKGEILWPAVCFCYVTILQETPTHMAINH